MKGAKKELFPSDITFVPFEYTQGIGSDVYLYIIRQSSQLLVHVWNLYSWSTSYQATIMYHKPRLPLAFW